MLADATNRLIATARDNTSTDADINAASQSFFDAIAEATRDDANAALRALSTCLDIENPTRAAFLALIGGALVEHGCDPLALAEPLIERLALLLESSVALATACVGQMPSSIGEDEDPIEVFEQIRQQLTPTMPEQAAAWEALEQFWRPAIAVFSVSSPARASARHLRDVACQISEFSEAGHWLRLMLSVLDDEPIVVIEPRTTLGMLARISGVVDNFQLSVLLMDRFPRPHWWSRRRISQRVADVARGNGPQQSDDTVTGCWNMYTWQALGPGLALPDPEDYGSHDVWIWNEGVPADIPVLDSRRVILLGPASYPRSWQSQRMFDRLAATLEIERQLTKDEIHDWLRRMQAAQKH